MKVSSSYNRPFNMVSSILFLALAVVAPSSIVHAQAQQQGQGECVDEPYTVMFQETEITCVTIETEGWCIDNEVSDTVNVEVVALEDDDNSMTLEQACCICGGGYYGGEDIDSEEMVEDDEEDTNSGGNGGGGGGSGGSDGGGNGNGGGNDGSAMTPPPSQASSLNNNTTDNDETPPTTGNNDDSEDPVDETPPTTDNDNDVSQDPGADLSCAAGPTLTPGSQSYGSLSSAITSFPGSFNLPCMSGLESMGSWYNVEGTDLILTLTACSQNPSQSIAIRVFTGDECESMTCLEDLNRQYTFLPSLGCESSYTVSWLSEMGVTYHIFVVGLPIGAGGSDLNVDTPTDTTASTNLRSLQSENDAVSTLSTPFTLSISEMDVAKNGMCDNAIALNADGDVVEGNNVGKIDHVPCHGDGETGTPGVWYTLTQKNSTSDSAAKTLVYQAHTCSPGTNFNSMVSVFTGNCDELACVDTQVLACQNGQPGYQVYWSASTEEELFLFVHGSHATEYHSDPATIDFHNGFFELAVSHSDEIENDDCATAKSLNIDADEIVGSTLGSKPDTDAEGTTSCGKQGAGVWYKLVGTGRTLQVTTCSGQTDHPTSIHVFSGSCGSLTCMDTEGGNEGLCDNADTAANSATVNFASQDKVEYYILVSSRDGSTGNFGLKVSQITSPVNDACESAFPLGIGENVGDDTKGATIDFPLGEVCGVSLDTPGVWFRTTGDGKAMSFSTCSSSDYNTAISVFKGSCTELECVAGTAAPDPQCEQGVTVAFLSQLDVPYYAFVHGVSPNSMGSFSIAAKSQELIQSNEFCLQAIPIEPDGERIQGSTEDSLFPAVQTEYCGVYMKNPGLWYKFDGTGNAIDISACSEDEGYDVSVSIFSGSCENPTCIAGSTFANNLCAIVGTGRHLQEPTSPSISFLTDANEVYFAFVHGQGGVGDFQLYLNDVLPSEAAATAIPISDLTYGTDLYRWTPMNQLLVIDTGYSLVSIIIPSKISEAKVETLGGSINYTPKPDWEGEDIMSVKGCRNSECHQFNVTVRVMGDEEDIANSPGPSGGAAGQTGSGSSGEEDDGGNKKLLWLLLLLLLPCLCCLCYYFWNKRRSRDEEEELDDGKQFKDEPDGNNEEDEEDPDDEDEEDEDDHEANNKEEGNGFEVKEEDWESDDDDDDDDDEEGSGDDDDDDDNDSDDDESGGKMA